MISVTTPVNSLGYGVVGRGLVRALHSAGARPALFPIGPVDCPDDDIHLLRKLATDALRYDPQAPSFRLWHGWEMAHHPTRGLRSGATFFELDRLRPEEVYQLNQLDIVFAFGGWAAGVMRRSGVTAAIREIHCAVDTDVFCLRPLPEDGPTVFVNAGKWEIRKGHDVLLSAFLRAFCPDDDVRLIMLCDNPFLSPDEAAGWVEYYKNHPLADKVVVLPRQPTRQDVAGVFAQAHCGVFPSRGEGWNMEAMELLAMGRHVIATAATAHLDYMSAKNAILVPPGPDEPAYDGKWFSGQGNWVSIPDHCIDQFAERMREFHQNRLAGHLLENEAGVETCRSLTWGSSALKIVDGLGVSYGV